MIGGSTTTPSKPGEHGPQDSVSILSAASIKQKNKKSVDSNLDMEFPSTTKERKRGNFLVSHVAMMQQSTEDETRTNRAGGGLPGSSKSHVVQIQMETALNQITQAHITPKDLTKENFKVELLSQKKEENRRRNLPPSMQDNMTENFSSAGAFQQQIVRNVPLHARPSTAIMRKGDNGSQKRCGPGVSLLRNLTLHTGASLAPADLSSQEEAVVVEEKLRANFSGNATTNHHANPSMPNSIMSQH